jgi:hypothetical protein
LPQTETLLKYNFNPAEPRDERGRWTADEGADSVAPARVGGPGGTGANGRDWQRFPNAEFRSAENLLWTKKLTGAEARCFSQLFRESHWNDMPNWEKDMAADARVARADLTGSGRKEYIYLIEGTGWCGTAGCKLLVGEQRDDGVCHLLYDGDGDDEITVLRRRDNGYRRLYTQCEIRFDGWQNQQIHPDCPTLDVQH